ncbi:MAG: hypothetical protein KDK08_28495 [Rhizobiaceae bacterium]|nr:hypothetical protein [Rhizobiaceae bacterium]
MQVTAVFHQSHEITRFLKNLSGPAMQQAAARGLTEHAQEQRRQSIVRIVAITALPRGRVAGPIKVKPAPAGLATEAQVHVADRAISLAEYGSPAWTRDLNPGWKGGAVSSMSGAEVTGWGYRRQHRGTWVANGQVYKRADYKNPRSKAKMLWGVVLANELAKPEWKNVAGAEAFAQLDLEKRVTRHVLRALGT